MTTTTISLDDCADTVAARVEGCPHGMIVEALRDAAIEFCIKTRVATAPVELTLNGTEEPDLGLVEQVVDIIDASIGGKRENVIVTYLNDAIDEETLEKGQYLLRLVDVNNFELEPAPTLAAPVTINLILAVAPGPQATDIPIELWRRHHEALRSGALARLLIEPKKPWTDAQLGVVHDNKFQRAITDAAGQAGRNRTQPARRLRTQPV